MELSEALIAGAESKQAAFGSDADEPARTVEGPPSPRPGGLGVTYV